MFSSVCTGTGTYFGNLIRLKYEAAKTVFSSFTRERNRYNMDYCGEKLRFVKGKHTRALRFHSGNLQSLIIRKMFNI